jgi:hypothetical protein
MKTGSAFQRSVFHSRDRAMGMVGAWTAFVVNEAYAVTSGLAFLSVKSSSSPISDPYLSIMSALVVLMAPFLVITMVAVHIYAAPEHKFFSQVSRQSSISPYLVSLASPHRHHRCGLRPSSLPNGRHCHKHWTSLPGIGSSDFPCCWRRLSFGEAGWGTRFAPSCLSQGPCVSWRLCGSRSHLRSPP